MGDSLVLLLKRDIISITLIPEVSNPSNISQLRPTSFTNFAYKVMAELMDNRTEPTFGNLIYHIQVAKKSIGMII